MKYLKTFESKGNSYRKYDIDGFIVYQGRTAEGNDFVTVELSDPEDYWFHAKGIPGSHVLIKIGDKLPNEDIIRKAAIIAAKNCKSKDSEIKIIYCKKKFVKKDRGFNIGQVRVDYSNTNEIIVNKN